MSIVKLSNNGVKNATAFGSLTSGSMTFIKKLTASSSATLSFVHGSNDVVLDNTYKEYIFTFKNIHAETDLTEFSFNLSIDSGSNYNVAKTSSFLEVYHLENDTNAGMGYGSSHDLAQGTGLQRMTSNQGNASDESANGSLHLFNPSSTTFVKHYIANLESAYWAEYQQHDLCAGYANTTSPINAIKFQFETGNIDSGDICLYGIN